MESSKEKPFFKDKSDAGKGDKPRNISRDFWDNYDQINWGMKRLKSDKKYSDESSPSKNK